MSEIPLATAKLKEASWFTLCEWIGDHNVEVTKYFSHNFKGSIVNIGGLEFPVTEESIAQAIGVAPGGKNTINN